MTSHAAVVARGWGRPCICGCQSLQIDESNGSMTITLEDGSTKTFREGDFLSLNGNTGEVLGGQQLVAPPAITGNLKTFMDWVDDVRDIDVLANADTPADAKEARNNGARGIGLCRTEHMFFLPERISQVRKLILGNEEQSAAALDELLVFQRTDFEGIFKEMDGLPVTIRLLDPPLHEFLPSMEDDEIITSLAEELDTTPDVVREQVKSAEEVNPMLGLRGCRLGITRPSIIEMQTRAIIEAALNAIDDGVDARADIMVPLVGKVEEFRNQAALIRSVAAQVFEERGKTCDFKVGTMIEIPRAALTAHKIAQEADFFSFGSNGEFTLYSELFSVSVYISSDNFYVTTLLLKIQIPFLKLDLTQMTFGYSRDDVGTFVPSYLNEGILMDDPFVTLDAEGVGQLIQMCTSTARSVKPEMKVSMSF